MVCARNLARFGLMLMNRGRRNGAPIVPEAWIEHTTAGAALLRRSFLETKLGKGLSGAHHRNQCFARQEFGIVICLGVHGQIIVFDPRTQFVPVKLTSHPEPASSEFYGEVFSAIFSLSATLS